MSHACNTSELDYVSYLVMHSIGHNAAINHPDDAKGYGNPK